MYKLLVMNNYTGLRDGLHGGSELVLLQRMVSVSLHLAPYIFSAVTVPAVHFACRGCCCF